MSFSTAVHSLTPEVSGDVIEIGRCAVEGPMAAADQPLPDLRVQRAVKLLDVAPAARV
jgi:hypothetical protein